VVFGSVSNFKNKERKTTMKRIIINTTIAALLSISASAEECTEVKMTEIKSVTTITHIGPDKVNSLVVHGEAIAPGLKIDIDSIKEFPDMLSTVEHMLSCHSSMVADVEYR
jgi:hypothetical protein